jgi:hypothetical protein
LHQNKSNFNFKAKEYDEERRKKKEGEKNRRGSDISGIVDHYVKYVAHVDTNVC